MTFVAETQTWQHKASSSSFTLANFQFKAGYLHFLYVASDNSTATTPTYTVTDRVDGETSSWSTVFTQNSPQASSAAGVRATLFLLEGTVSGTRTVTVSLSSSRTAKAAVLVRLSHSNGLPTVSGTDVAIGTTVTISTAYVAVSDGDTALAFGAREQTTPPDVFIEGWATYFAPQTTAGTTGSSAATNVSVCAAVLADPFDESEFGDVRARIFNSNTDGGVGIVVLSPPPPPPAQRTHVWNGSAWVKKPVRVWDGSAWAEKPVKVWDGSAWVT